MAPDCWSTADRTRTACSSRSTSRCRRGTGGWTSSCCRTPTRITSRGSCGCWSGTASGGCSSPGCMGQDPGGLPGIRPCGTARRERPWPRAPGCDSTRSRSPRSGLTPAYPRSPPPRVGGSTTPRSSCSARPMGVASCSRAMPRMTWTRCWSLAASRRSTSSRSRTTGVRPRPARRSLRPCDRRSRSSPWGRTTTTGTPPPRPSPACATSGRASFARISPARWRWTSRPTGCTSGLRGLAGRLPPAGW